MSSLKRFRMRQVGEEDFARFIEEELDERFREAQRQNLTQELANGFVQANVTLSFVLLARKSQGALAAKACCKCRPDKDDPQVIRCKGRCCGDLVGLPGDDEIVIITPSG